MRKYPIFLLFFALIGNSAWSQEPKKKVAPEREAMEAASLRYDRDIADAKKAYEESLRQASKKLINAYDASIGSAMKRGGGDALDLANELNSEKKELQVKIDINLASQSKESTASAAHDKLKKLLTSKVWYFHWEENPPNRNHPLRFLPNGRVEGDPGGSWSIEPMWVVKNAGSYHLLIDDKTMRGFFVPTGRQTGMIAD